jgi:hypothetical protein
MLVCFYVLKAFLERINFFLFYINIFLVFLDYFNVLI